MEPLISLVIPVYNVEPFLRKCVESARAQTYPNYEVILVDDGSTDNSGKMCDEYAAKDSRITVFHKPNGGLSSARNFGVEKARGELIAFQDSDDFMTEDYLSYLYQLMVKFDADVSSARFWIVYDDVQPKIDDSVPVEIVLDAEGALEKLSSNMSADSKLYHKELLLRYPFPVGRLHEDLATLYKVIGDCKRVVFSDKKIGFYIQRKGSILGSPIDERQFDLFWAADGFVEYVGKYFPRALSAAETRYATSMMQFCNNLFECTEDKQREYFQRARARALPYVKHVLFGKQASLHVRVFSCAIWMGYLPSKAIWALKLTVKKILGRNRITGYPGGGNSTPAA